MNTQLERIASEINHPCVSISLNTHRTHPDNIPDPLELKKLLKEAKDSVIEAYGKRTTEDLLEKIDTLSEEIDMNYNSDSMHIFLSNTTHEIIKSAWPIPTNVVHVAETFSVKPLIKLFNRTENYLILLLSQSGVHMYHAINDSIIEEFKNDDFPFSSNQHYATHDIKISDSKHTDNLLREYLNKVDKAANKVYNDSEMKMVVICTEDNYSRLMQVADKPSIYLGYVPVNYNDVTPKTIAAAAWKIVEVLQTQTRIDAVSEMQEAVGQGNVITDFSEIYKAVKEGRGDLLITHDDFKPSVKKTGEYSIEIVDGANQPDEQEDIISEMAWEVLSKKGRAIFTHQDAIKSFGDIVLKVRY